MSIGSASSRRTQTTRPTCQSDRTRRSRSGRASPQPRQRRPPPGTRTRSRRPASPMPRRRPRLRRGPTFSLPPPPSAPQLPPLADAFAALLEGRAGAARAGRAAGLAIGRRWPTCRSATYPKSRLTTVASTLHQSHHAPTPCLTRIHHHKQLALFCTHA